MKNINTYITEKLHLNKDIKVSNKEDIIDYVTNVIYDTLNDGFKLTENDCRIYWVKDGNLLAHTPEETTAISLCLKNENRRNKKLYDDIKDKLSKELHDYEVILEQNTISSDAYKIKIYFSKNISVVEKLKLDKNINVKSSEIEEYVDYVSELFDKMEWPEGYDIEIREYENTHEQYIYIQLKRHISQVTAQRIVKELNHTFISEKKKIRCYYGSKGREWTHFSLVLVK